MANEETLVQDYLLSYLGADSTLSSLVNGVWTRSVPTSAPAPLVKMEVLSREDLMVVNLFRVWADLTVLVRAVAENNSGFGEAEDWSEVEAIGDRIDALLHKHEDTTSTIQMHSFREESFSDETIENQKLFLHSGGIYRIRAKAV